MIVSFPRLAGEPTIPCSRSRLSPRRRRPSFFILLKSRLRGNERPWLVLPPHLVRQLNDHAKLRPLLVLGQNVSFFGRGEAALRRQAELIERDELRGFFDALLDIRARLEAARLRRYQAEHHDLVPLRQEPQRLKAAGAVGVVFEEVAVVVALAEKIFRHRLIAAG